MDDNQQNSIPPADASGLGETNKTGETNRDDGSARARLLEAATKLFAASGLEGTSIRDIAKEAELNISLISYYFGGKEGLYKAVFFEHASAMAQQVDQLLQPMDLQNLTAETFKSGMRTFIKSMLPMKFANKPMQSLMQREMIAGLPHAKEVYEQVFSKILENVVAIYKTGQKKGFVRNDVNPYVLFLTMAHSTDVYIQMCNCDTKIQDKVLKLPEQLDEYADQIHRIFVEGVLV